MAMTKFVKNVFVFTCMLGFLIASMPSNASEYNFGSACRTNGHWTQTALQETQKLIEVLNQFKNDENCHGLESIVQKLMSTDERFKNSINATKGEITDQIVDGIDNENINGQKEFLNNMVNNGKGSIKNKGEFLDLLAGVHMNSAINSSYDFTKNLSAAYFNKEQVVRGLHQSASELIGVVNQALNAFIGPKLNQCLVKTPEQGLVVIAGMMRLVANTSVPGVSVTANRIGETINNLVQYMRQMGFAKSLKGLKQHELWASITCALESSAEHYCTARDQLKLLNWGLESMDKSGIYADANSVDPVKGNFLTGYATLIRNVPVIAKWLLKVQFGVEPKLMTDATYKNSIWQTVIGIISSINDLNANFNEYKINILNSNDPKTQKNMIFGMISKIKNTMSGAVMSSGGSEINFYTNSLPMRYLPLVLIGMNEGDYPKDVLPKESGLIISAEEWLQNGGKYQPMFDDPIKLLEIIKLNMERIIESVQDEMRKYFIDRLIVDKMNLVAEAFTIDSMGTSVDDSMKIILRYLEGLKQRVHNSPFGDEQVIHLINDTLTQLSQVVVAIDEYGKHKGSEKEIQKAAAKVIDIVYEEFNVLIQRDSFITNRMATLVHYDYFLQILENRDIGQYERDLMIISNNEAYQKLILSHSDNVAAAAAEYKTALMIHRNNIDELEYLFRDNFLSYLRTIIDDSNGVPLVLRNARSLLNMKYDNILLLPKSILGYQYRYQMEMINPFNLSYKRGNILKGGDNESSSFMANRNKACIQLLAATEPLAIYSKLCSGAVMTSPFVEAAGSEQRKQELAFLNVDFNSYAKYFSKKTDDDKICAYRDYLRRNHVHWMTLQHNQIKAHKRKVAENETKAGGILERARTRMLLKQLNLAEKKKKDWILQMKDMEQEVLKLTNETKRVKKKIENRKEGLEFYNKGASDQAELRKKKEDIFGLEEKLEELEDTIEERSQRMEIIKADITLLDFDIEKLKDIDVSDL